MKEHKKISAGGIQEVLMVDRKETLKKLEINNKSKDEKPNVNDNLDDNGNTGRNDNGGNRHQRKRTPKGS